MIVPRPFLFVAMLAPLLAQAAVDPGEILLSEMNCVACHKAAPEVDARLASRKSPRLGKDGVRITPHHLRAFIENPAAAKPGTLMPDALHGLPPAEKAEAAEALTHYLVSLQGEDTSQQTSESAAAIAVGQQLYHSVGCVQCHAPQVPPAGDEKRKAELEQLQQTSVPMGPLAEKYTVNELAAFLRDPLKTRPSGRMPSLKLDAAEARAIAMYLVREQMPAGAAAKLAGLNFEYYEESLPELPEFDRLKPKTTGIAETISIKGAQRKNDFAFRWRGVLTAPVEGEYKFWTNSDDGSRLFIDGKKIVENGGIHPAQDRDGKVKLSAGDHLIEVQYFDGGGQTELKVEWRPPGGQRGAIPASALSHEGQPMRPVGEVAFAVDAAKAARGRELFAKHNCASCHQIDAPGTPAKALAQLVARQPAGCLATKPGPNVPKFEITERQRVVLLAGLQNQAIWNEPLDADAQIKRTMTTLNCYACHQRDRRGGVNGVHREYLTSVGEVDLGDEGRVPPTLEKVGAKLRPEWTREVLVKGGAVRPYMATRMPQFGEANVKLLPELFDKADTRPDAEADPNNFKDDAATQAKWGRKLVGTAGLSCIACHNFAGNKSLGIPALDLTTTGRRLKYDWFHRYLADPQSLRPGTRMPAFWPEGVASKKDILAGDANAQMRAIWLYLARQNFTDLPDGLIQGQQEIVADREAVIYRNFIEGAGSRAIGVGYPEKANIAFDANELRLALMWQGPFIDAAKHRTGRGAGYEKPLGGNLVKGPPGAPFAVLDSDSAAWPLQTGKAAGYRFGGYRLDERQRPAFLYSFGDVSVEDFPQAVPGSVDAKLRRTFTLRAKQAPSRLHFRAAVGEKIEEVDGGFLVDGKVRLEFPGAKPLVRQSEGRAELLVPVTFQNGEAKLIEEIIW
jgi:cytochrome c